MVEKKNMKDNITFISLKNVMKKKKDKEEIINLNDKIDAFVNWYLNNYNYRVGVRNFIEKMAIWFEMKYTDSTINAMGEKLEINDSFGYSNFVQLLNAEEKGFLEKPKYEKMVFFNLYRCSTYLVLDENGIIKESYYVKDYAKSIVDDEELIGMHVKDALNLFNNRKIKLPIDNELAESVRKYADKMYQIEELLTAVMFRIMERGGSIIGPRRAYLFAKEFNRNKDLVMKYGVDYEDPNLYSFVTEYINDGGSYDLECFANYFTNKDELCKITIDQLLIKLENNFDLYDDIKLVRSSN